MQSSEHSTKASRLLSQAAEAYGELENVVYNERPMYLSKIQVLVQMAQVHATLAVAKK